MGYIAEPEDVDLVIAGGKLTPEDRKLIRAMIARQKVADKVRVARVRASGPTRLRKARKAARSKTNA